MALFQVLQTRPRRSSLITGLKLSHPTTGCLRALPRLRREEDVWAGGQSRHGRVGTNGGGGDPYSCPTSAPSCIAPTRRLNPRTSALLLLTFRVDRVPVVNQVAKVREVRAFPIRNGRRRRVWLASYLFGFRSAEYRRRPAGHRRWVHRHGGARGGQVGAFVRGALHEQSFCTSRGCSGPPH